MLGNRIKDLRTQKGITQEQLSKHLHVAKSTVGMWENNKREPDINTLIKISNFFDCSIDLLINDTVQLKAVFHESEPEHICPICGYDYVHFIKVISIDFDNEKSGGIALQFLCECEHVFYIIIEDYKGNSYLTYTDDKFNIIEPVSTKSQNVKSFTEEKYNILDEHGKKMVDFTLNEEYKRCLEHLHNI